MKKYYNLNSVEIAALLAENGKVRLSDEDFCIFKNNCIEYKNQHYPNSNYSAEDIASDIDYDFPHNSLAEDNLLIPEYFTKVFEKDIRLNYDHDNLKLPLADYWKFVVICNNYKKKHHPKTDYSGTDCATDIYMLHPYNTLEEDELLIPRFMNKNRKDDILATCEPQLIFQQGIIAQHYTTAKRFNDNNYRILNNKQKNDSEKNLRLNGSPSITVRNSLQREKRTKKENHTSCINYLATLQLDPEKNIKRKKYKNENAKKQRNKKRKRGKGMAGKRKR